MSPEYHNYSYLVNNRRYQQTVYCRSMDTLGDRVRSEREERGWTQEELAKRVTRAGFKIGQAGIAQIERRGDSEPKCIVQLGMALSVTAKWLQDGKGAKAPKNSPEQAERQPRPMLTVTADHVIVPELDVHVSAGMGGDGESVIMANAEGSAVLGTFAFPAAGFREMVNGPTSGIRIISVRGDSMQPTLWPGQRVMVDTNDKVPSPPGVFVVWDGLSLVLKRIELVPGSDPMRVRITSDNNKYTAYERTIEEAHINGRVVGVWARM